MENYTDYTLGAGAGYAAYVGSKKVLNKAKKPYVNKVIQNMSNYSEAENQALKKATYDAFSKSGLKAKKYYLHDINPDNAESMANLFEKKFDAMIKGNKFFAKLENFRKKLEELKTKIDKIKKTKAPNKPSVSKNIKHSEENLAQKIKNPQNVNIDGIKDNINKVGDSKLSDKIIKRDNKVKLSKQIKSVAEGKNAFCSPITRDIMVNTDKLSSASFHEMGHALNATGSKAIQALAVGRHVTKLFIPIILAIGLLKPKKKDGEKPQGIIDKTTTFIKENAGKLTFAALIPTLAEEGLASIRGGKLAKQVLDPKLLKKVNKGNMLAWTTYLAGALVTSGAVAFATKVRDKMAS